MSRRRRRLAGCGCRCGKRETGKSGNPEIGARRSEAENRVWWFGTHKMSHAFFAFFTLILLVWLVLRRKRKQKPFDLPLKTMAVLGSGGHTTEMMGMLASLDEEKLTLLLVVAQTDAHSRNFVEARIGDHLKRASWATIPRSREVGQGWMSSAVTAAISLCHTIVLVAKFRPDLVLVNGPGTCVPVCVSAWFWRVRPSSAWGHGRAAIARLPRKDYFRGERLPRDVLVTFRQVDASNFGQASCSMASIGGEAPQSGILWIGPLTHTDTHSALYD
eukprot:Polyplicarium_translucidae@DN2229_c0_g1_i1.p1